MQHITEAPENGNMFSFCRSTEAEQRAAMAWLHDYAAFWQVRGAFYKLAFGLGEGAVNAAAKPIPEAEGFISLKPVIARQLWAQAMREVGGTLTREKAAELSAMLPTARRAMAEASADALGVTAAGRKRFLGIVELEDPSLWAGPDFWDWVARERIASAFGV